MFIKKKAIFKIKYIVTLLTSIIFVSIMFGGCSSVPVAKPPFSVSSFALDTVISITYYDKKDEAAVSSALRLCEDYELILSRTNEKSELYQLNQALDAASDADIFMDVSDVSYKNSDIQSELQQYVTEINRPVYGFKISEELYHVLSECCDYAKISIDGFHAFNYALGYLSDIYNFSGEEHEIPTTNQISYVLSHANPALFKTWSDSNREFYFLTGDTDITLDLGAIAKGYISDRMKEKMKAEGVTSAIINLGGNILLLGSRPDGSDFEIGIADPANANNYITTVKVSDCAVVTSGVYQRYFEKNGRIFHHLLDPQTGFPVDNGLKSASIITTTGTAADALSTIFFVFGAEKKEELLKFFPDVQVIYVD